LAKSGGVNHENVPSIASTSSGILTLRGKTDFLSFSCQPNGTRGVGNHTHNDKLSFTLHVAGDDFLVDPGTYLYTSDPERRNLFRSTAMHNTVTVDHQEQNEFIPHSLFSLENTVRIITDASNSESRLMARHTGYARFSDPVIHSRTIERQSNPLSWIVRDELIGRHEHHLQWSFIPGPDIIVELVNGNSVRLAGKAGVLLISCQLEGVRTSIEEGTVSKVYGRRVSTALVHFELSAHLPAKAAFNLTWESCSHN